MDHASFHNAQKTKKLIESAGCGLVFLPLYLPNLNPIETFWATMKRWINRTISQCTELSKALLQFF
ncbi:transposase [Holospora curviuscula]|uniref:Tc1-like transposase DDE domain-containing protein n=1 Tax=Holospora curviuscula TaxID=1082868 RepID=A0A2S5R7Q4_9PROT|nr:hypothetical protein HCUR_01238 [Holospora curviuscula]